jgi:hypothetical protein
MAEPRPGLVVDRGADHAARQDERMAEVGGSCLRHLIHGVRSFFVEERIARSTRLRRVGSAESGDG